MTNHLVLRAALTCAVGGVLLTISVPVTDAQSLGDVARREAERRKQVASGKVYTDGDLDASTAPASRIAAEGPPASANGTPDTPSAPAQAAPANKPGTEPIIVKAREKRDEQYWRTLTRDLRGRVAKATSEVAAREGRIAEIEGSPQTPTLIKERDTLAAGLPRLQRDARSLTEELTRFLTRAQMAKVPDEWIQ